jgi:hypothetical protein
MTLFTIAGILAAALGFGAWRARYPNCPRCGSRRWDRKLCHPLLFCRKCATRCDMQGLTYN